MANWLPYTITAGVIVNTIILGFLTFYLKGNLNELRVRNNLNRHIIFKEFRDLMFQNGQETCHRLGIKDQEDLDLHIQRSVDFLNQSYLASAFTEEEIDFMNRNLHGSIEKLENTRKKQ